MKFDQLYWTGFHTGADTTPLEVHCAGYSRWGTGDFFEREVSAVQGIEQVTHGDMLFTQNGKQYHVTKGMVFILRARVAHRYETGPAGIVHKRFMMLQGPSLASVLTSTGLWECDVVQPNSPDRIAALLRETNRLLVRKGPGWFERLTNIAYEVLVHLGRSLAPQRPYAIEQALEFIEQNIRMPLTNNDIAARSGLSLPHFNRLFRLHVGVAPIQYVIEHKMNQARFYLVKTEMPVKEISARLGYEDQLYFSAQFKKQTGSSPAAFRRAARDAEACAVPVSPENSA